MAVELELDTMLSAQRTGNTMGAEIHGANLSEDMDDATFAAILEGMPEDEALSLLRELAAHSTQPQYRFSVRYGVGDVVAWDNAAVLHSATLVDPGDPRTLWRITVKERERPMA